MLDWGPDPPMGRGNFGEKGAQCKVQKHPAVKCAKAAELIVMLFGLWAQNGPRIIKDGVQMPP